MLAGIAGARVGEGWVKTPRREKRWGRETGAACTLLRPVQQLGLTCAAAPHPPSFLLFSFAPLLSRRAVEAKKAAGVQDLLALDLGAGSGLLSMMAARCGRAAASSMTAAHSMHCTRVCAWPAVPCPAAAASLRSERVDQVAHELCLLSLLNLPP